MKTNRQFSPRHEAQAERTLVGAMLTCRTADELRAFLKDLCTPAELQAMADRWAVVKPCSRNFPTGDPRYGLSLTPSGASPLPSHRVAASAGR